MGIPNVGIVGCGAVVEQYYTPALGELARRGVLRVGALYDPDRGRLATIQAGFPTARSTSDLEQFAGLDIDLAIVASPPSYHAEQTIRLLRRGIAVLCEKPMAASVAEAEAMIEAAKSTGRVLAIGLVRRFFPATRALHELFAQGHLGDVCSFHCSEGGVFRWPAQTESFFAKANKGGGVLFDVGVHLLDLLIWWWGWPTGIAYEDDALGGVEANCRIQLSFGRGFSGEVRLSRDCPVSNRYVINCTSGDVAWQVKEADRIELRYRDVNTLLDGRLFETDTEMPSTQRRAITFQQSFLRQLENVVAAVQGREPVVVSGTDGLASLKLIEWCYAQRRLLPMPWLAPEEASRAMVLSQTSG